MPPDATAPPALQATYDQLMALITGRPSGDSARAPARADTLVAGDARATADQRVQVYAHMYRARMIEALESQFPRLARWIGADGFAALTLAYVTDRPSRHPSLRFIGQHFPDWLAARAQPATRDAALAALARLEWARADVFDDADQAALTLDSVRAWPVEQFASLPLQLIGAHRLLTVAPAVAALWNAIGDGAATADADPDAAAATSAAREQMVTATSSRESLLIWRQGVNVFHRVIDDAERGALQTMAAGTTFGVVCEAMLHQHAGDEATATAQAFGWLSTWTTDELLLPP